MSETLSQKRCRFTRDVAKLLAYVETLPGYAVALDQVKRTQAEADANSASGAGISNSLHLIGLAVDLLLYVDGVYQENSAAHATLGAYWKSLHPDNCHGGDFAKPDGGHYSVQNEGVR